MGDFTKILSCYFVICFLEWKYREGKGSEKVFARSHLTLPRFLPVQELTTPSPHSWASAVTATGEIENNIPSTMRCPSVLFFSLLSIFHWFRVEIKDRIKLVGADDSLGGTELQGGFLGLSLNSGQRWRSESYPSRPYGEVEHIPEPFFGCPVICSAYLLLLFFVLPTV